MKIIQISYSEIIIEILLLKMNAVILEFRTGMTMERSCLDSIYKFRKS